MMKTPLYASVIIGAFVSTLSAADAINGSNADSPLPGSINRLAQALPPELQQFVCHENIPGISNNVLLRLTQAQYDAHCSVIAGLSHVSFIIIKEEPGLTQSTQDSQPSVASTVVVNFSQDSQESLPPQTQPAFPDSQEPLPPTVPHMLTEES
ncbi:hypothetical protein [Candidatus Bodocaedibacter vickermanii]|uniref:Uncharacterized protein n=1 Tax=Candidatus Bodocaedibacter vickermanii TaxID=2741701 RepID=A0A7L9RS25_9PROT|nr:hypothetical protein CPBP_00165 [Candidatus Paracaedibacteraceae bacterium 'Lake Konstanz']